MINKLLVSQLFEQSIDFLKQNRQKESHLMTKSNLNIKPIGQEE